MEYYEVQQNQLFFPNRPFFTLFFLGEKKKKRKLIIKKKIEQY